MTRDKLPYDFIHAHEEAEREFNTLLARHLQEGRLEKVDHEYFSRALRDRTSLSLTLKFASQHWQDPFILDLGCGMGALEVEMCRNGKHECVGLDANIFFIRLASVRLKLHGCPNASLLVGDVRTLPFRRGTFNLVILHDIAFAVKLSSFLGEVANVLKKRGGFIFDVPLAFFYHIIPVKRSFIKYTRVEVATALMHEGFKQEHVFLPGIPPTLQEYAHLPASLLRTISGLLVCLPSRLQEIMGEFWFTLVFVARKLDNGNVAPG